MQIVQRMVAGALTLALAGLSGSALAQGYPTKAITLVVPFAAGGPTDIVARNLTQKLSELTGGNFVVEMGAPVKKSGEIDKGIAN